MYKCATLWVISIYSTVLFVASHRILIERTLIRVGLIQKLFYQHAGAGFWGNVMPRIRASMKNTSAFLANTPIVYCHSSSYMPNIGRWISPKGEDITNNHTDQFSIRFDNGPDSPSFSILQLQELVTSLSPADQGIYSCITYDSRGFQQILNIGIYPAGYPGVFSYC